MREKPGDRGIAMPFDAHSFEFGFFAGILLAGLIMALVSL